MRTVGGSTISQALIDTQKDASRTPYIDITIDSVNYWSRLEYLEYHEEAYRDRAIIGLNNRDKFLDGLDLDGKEFAIKLGYDSSGHGGSATDTVTYPTLWVKSHQIISTMGQRYYQIYAEGMWMRLREQKVVPSAMTWVAAKAYLENQYISPTTPNGHRYKCTTAGTSHAATEPTWPTTSGTTVNDNTAVWTEDGVSALYSNIFNATHTVEEIMQLIIEGLGWTWTSVGGTNDGIIQTYQPIFEINAMGFENAAALLYRLIWMTKHYLRVRASKVMGTVFPQTTDPVDENYYSDQANWFTEYVEKSILLIPNSIAVFCNQDPSGQWNTTSYPLRVGTASDAVQIAKYAEIVQPFVAGSIAGQADANNRAAAILSKFKSEILGGRLVAPHDCRVELYDKMGVYDRRE